MSRPRCPHYTTICRVIGSKAPYVVGPTYRNFPACTALAHDAGKTGLSSRESTCVYAATKAEKLSGGAPAAWRREVVMRTASLRTSGMRAAAFQFFGNCSELGRKFEQRLPRVDLRRLFRELQAFFGMLSAFFRRTHDGDPNLCNIHPGGIVPLPPLPMNRIVSDSILDDPEHWQERAEEARSIRGAAMRGRYRPWRAGAANANLENTETWKILVTRVKRIRLPAARIPL